MLDGIGKHLSFPFAVFGGALLASEHYRFTAIYFVDAVNDSVKPFHLLEQLCVVVKQIGLDGGVGADVVKKVSVLQPNLY